MADSQNKIDAAAEKAFAEAAEKKAAEAVSAKAVAKAVEADKPAPAKAAKVAEAVAAKPAPAKAAATPAPAKKTAAKKVAKAPAKKKPATKRLAKKAAPVKKAATAKSAETKNTPITKLKDTIMATAKNAKTTEYTAKVKETAAELQTRAKAAYDKGAEMTSDVAEFQKGNLEALVESGKILASGMQDMGRTYVEEAKVAVATVQADVKKVAAIKSPTELFQLQGEIARRNFDAVIATASKNTETMVKLVNEAFAPVSTRMSVAAEKFSKAA
ncbi:phasin family protein [Qipengyuania marisflavi]|uniref:Phasin family protein n=1 Tax=Qipengyuania marisflavi TaxID=2486356 RepID=A0A5S3P0B2_9SPHN|nr:phasin family protein [Qipengyuania marisflavi]TMM46159.1 phasin family protein [Qipengyuania marisflavi]